MESGYSLPAGLFGERLAQWTYSPSTNLSGGKLQPFDRPDIEVQVVLKNPFGSRKMWSVGVRASRFTRAVKVQPHRSPFIVQLSSAPSPHPDFCLVFVFLSPVVTWMRTSGSCNSH